MPVAFVFLVLLLNGRYPGKHLLLLLLSNKLNKLRPFHKLCFIMARSLANSIKRVNP
jgi:hypothetical protein